MGKMCWRSPVSDGEKILYLQFSDGQAWVPYTACRQHSVPDYKIPGGSKGWATYQKLLKAGWQLISSNNDSVIDKNFVKVLDNI